MYQVIGQCTVDNFPFKGGYDVRLIRFAGFGGICVLGFIDGL